MTTLVGNIEVNARLQDRRSASGIAAGALYGLDKMDWTAFDDLVDLANTSNDYYIEVDSTSCVSLGDDEALCDEIFGGYFNNLSLDNTTFKVYIYDYNLPSASYNSLINNAEIPLEVRDEISLVPQDTAFSTDLLRVTVWIEYSDNPVSAMAISGVILE